MNRDHLLDSLDGLKGLLFRLLPADILKNIACVPMTTDGPWADADKTIFELSIGIPHDRTYWTPGEFINVPPSDSTGRRSDWVDSIAAIDHPYIFLDPDIGFYSHHNGDSEKKVLIVELSEILQHRNALIVYRHQYWPNPKPDNVPSHVYPYVWHCLTLLRHAKLTTLAYQSQSASFFFVSRMPSEIRRFERGLRLAMVRLSASVVQKRLVK